MAGSEVKTLLPHRINTLLLNANAAFPSQAKDAKHLIKEWRYEQRCKLVRSDDSPSGAASGYPSSFAGMGVKR